MCRKYLISFASPDLKRSVSRYYRQAKELNFYDDIFIFSISDLRDKDKKYIFDLLKKK